MLGDKCTATPRKALMLMVDDLVCCYEKYQWDFVERLDRYHIGGCISTSVRPQLQIMESPPSIKKDLFAQLLCTYHSGNFVYMEESINEESDTISDTVNRYDEFEGECYSESSTESNKDIASTVLIRCRKTPDQIKILRKELRVSGEWEKKDVVRMAEMTGLSMSQVYKWFWDQRKRKIEGPRRRKVWAEEVGQYEWVLKDDIEESWQRMTGKRQSSVSIYGDDNILVHPRKLPKKLILV